MTRGYPGPGETDILFVTYGGGHVQMVVPVAKELQRRGYRVKVFALTTAIAVVAAEGLDYFTYADLPQAQLPTIRETGERLLRQMPDGGPLPPTETRAYLGINFVDLVVDLGAEKAAALWEQGGRQHFAPLSTMKAVIRDLFPRLVVATNSPRSEKAAIEAASALGIPAVVMVDMFALQEVRWLARPGFGDRLLVLNESVKRMMTRHDRPEKDIVVTGNPAFDGIHDPAVIAAGGRIRKQRGWGLNGRLTMLYASTPEPRLHPFTGEPANPELPGLVEEHLRSLVCRDSRLELVIRRHPSEDQDILTGNHIHASTRADDINALIHAMDLVVVTCSTVGLQAYLAGKPVVSIEGSAFTKDAPYGEYGMATPVSHFSGLGPVLNKVIAETMASKGPSIELRAENATDRVVTGLEEFLKVTHCGSGYSK